jgi:hypothetical protein
MSQMKNRIGALALLDRAFTACTDDDLAALVDKLPDDHRVALDRLAGARDESGFSDPDARALAVRATAARGRLNGGLEQIATVLTDPVLAQCIEALGSNADHPSHEQLMEVTPALVEAWGVPAVRLMLAGSVAGEASASVMLTDVLKHDETLALPPVERTETVVLPPPTADDDVRARRKAARQLKQAEARHRREQQADARHRT